MSFRTKRVLLLQKTSVVTVTENFLQTQPLCCWCKRERLHIVYKHDGFRALPRETNVLHAPNTTTNTPDLQDDPAIPLIRSLKGRSQELYPRITRNVQTTSTSRSRPRELYGLTRFLYPQIKRSTLDLDVFPLHSFPCYDDSDRSSYLQDLVRWLASSGLAPC
jgi:hypothetical protein